MPTPPRTTVSPLPFMSQAKPTRGVAKNQLPLTPESGTLESFWFQTTPGKLPVPSPYCDWSNAAMPSPLLSSQGPKYEKRTP